MPLNGSPNVYVCIISFIYNNAIVFVFFGIIVYFDNVFLVQIFRLGFPICAPFTMGHPLFKAGCTIDYSFVAFFTRFMVDFRIFVSFVLYLRNECYFFVILTPLRLQFSGEWMLTIASPHFAG